MMQSYIESKLIAAHRAKYSFRFGEKFATFCTALALSLLLPYLHIGVFYHIWQPDKPAVDRRRCTCDCFDTVFRGRYEWPPSTYKHFYFNSTRSMLGVWFIVVCGIVLLYECARYIVPLVYYSRCLLRHEMLALFFSSLYPHYYGWWGLLNYINEDFYAQWKHQLFFTVTEIISTAMVVHLCCRDNRMSPWKLLFVIAINLTHIIVSGLDQFVTNVIQRGGQQFEAVRDLALMAPDVFHVLLAYFELSQLAAVRRTRVLNLFHREELLLSLLAVILMSLLGKAL